MALCHKIRASLPAFDLWRIAVVLLALLAPAGLAASPLSNHLSDPKLLGSSTFRFLGLPIYDARLYTPGGAPFNWSEDFGLELTYRRNIKKMALIDSTLEEMDRQGNSLPIRSELESCFQTITPGDRYLAISQGPDRVSYWFNGKMACTIAHRGIKRAFMSIFLGDRTRSASFTRQLKGL
ncbi:hypothetical protein [Ruegeria sp.]|uniref:hypothetical protein n=1 Tax=Ruegeria sp. TaxID=1879320 RepID=UPI0023283E9C|nr:hypothetical protein [Ruegeria sp.]MDA7965384.1 hypothetical protein [Ruegeria sp.]